MSVSYKTAIALTFIFSLVGTTVQAKTESRLSVKLNTVAHYQCDGVKVVARYYRLSDGSLNFVKLKKQNMTYTLPQTMSASGSRYTDGFKMEWWEHQGEVMMKDLTAKENEPAIMCATLTSAKKRQ